MLRIETLTAERGRIVSDLRLVIEMADTWIHGELCGTRSYQTEMAKLDPARKWLAPQEGQS